MSDAVASLATNATATRKRVLALLVIAAFLLLLVTNLIHGDELVDHVPLPYEIAWGAFGLAGGLYSTVKMQDRLKERGWRGYAAVLVLPVLAVAIGTYVGRLVYESIGFAGETPIETSVEAPIINMSSGRSGLHATVMIGPGSREISASVTGQLYGQLDAYRHPGRDCLVLTVQRGATVFAVRFSPTCWNRRST
jgi:hypothetical protein